MAGSPRPSLAVATLLVLVAMLAPHALAQAVRATAEIRITFPEGPRPRVTVSPTTDSIVLDLPSDSVFPSDFAASSGGLLRDGKAEPSADRVRLELELGLGTLERIDYEKDALVLHLQSRFQAAGTAASAEDRYVLGPDDKIRVLVHNQPDYLNTPLAVTREGMITAPLIGDVRAAGLTCRELAAKLAELLGRSYLRNPKVDVEVEEYLSQWVMVNGQVMKPGRLPLRGGTRLKEIVAQVEGFTLDAGQKIVVSRPKGTTGETIRLEVLRSDLEGGKSNPPLAHGDIVEVPMALFCYIQGEVRSPTRVPVEPGLTLLRVIPMAGGLTEWANRKTVTVLSGEPEAQTSRVFNLKKIEEGETLDPVLHGGEVIIVRKRYL